MDAILLVVARSAFVVCILSAFGSALFAQTLMRPLLRGLDAKAQGLITDRVLAITMVSLAAALPAAVAWLVLAAMSMSEASTFAEAVRIAPGILFDTSFGRVLALQAACIAGALALAALIRQPNSPATGLAGLVTLLEAGHGHGFAMGEATLLVSQGLHLLASGAWLGALVPLVTVVRKAPLPAAALAARRFAAPGAIAVGVLAVTAFYQGLVLGGGLQGLTGTAYGAVLLAKAALFAFMLAIAAINRWRLSPALAGGDGGPARGALAASIAVETSLGLLVVLAASALSQLEPGMHMTP